MSELVESSIAKMLGAFGVRITPDRVESYVDAVNDEQLCDRCVVRACRTIVRESKRVPFAVALVEATREEMGSADHVTHINERRQLTSGDLGAWWLTEAPVFIRKAWPELTSEQAIEVAQKMEGLGYVAPTWESIAADIGFVDQHGPSEERRWWLRHMPELTAVGEDPRFR